MIIDISHHHPVTNWGKVKEAVKPEGFIISKATEGTGFVDSTLDSFISNCEKNNIQYWLYVFLRKGNEIEQVKFMLKTCGKKVGENFVGYCLDVESMNTSKNVSEALAYLKEHTNKKTMLYTAYKDYDLYKSIIAKRGSTLWWEARYGLNNGRYNAKYPAHYGVDLHQFTSNGKILGIMGDIDLSRLTGRKLSKAFKNGEKTPKTAKPKKGKAYGGSFPKLPLRGYFRFGDTGSEVGKLQKFLRWHGSKILIDGIYGEKTMNAVKSFQKAKKLKADGLWGKETQTKAKEATK